MSLGLYSKDGLVCMYSRHNPTFLYENISIMGMQNDICVKSFCSILTIAYAISTDLIKEHRNNNSTMVFNER